MGASTGLKAVLSERAADLRAAPPVDAAKQLDWLPETTPVDLINVAAVAAGGERERKAGRPKGAGNFSTRQWREFLLTHGPSPLVQMMRWCSMTPEEMAARLGIKVGEAWDRQATMWDRLSPYLHARVAPTDEAGNAVPGLAMFIGGQGVNTSLDGLPPWHRAFQTIDGKAVEFQGVSNSNNEKSDGEKSDEGE